MSMRIYTIERLTDDTRRVAYIGPTPETTGEIRLHVGKAYDLLIATLKKHNYQLVQGHLEVPA